MTIEAVEIKGNRALVCAPHGPPLGSEQDALDLIGAGYEHQAEIVVIPVERLAPDFFRLRTGVLGAFVQKLQNYRHRLAIVGDISDQIVQSNALRDFVYESNKGGSVLFVADRAELEARL